MEEMGYQKKLYIGTAGSTATQQVTQATDVEYDLAPEKASTMSRGDGNSIPIKTERVVSLAPTVTFKMLDDPTDARLITLLAAAKTGAPVAVKVTDNGGGTLFDGDMTLSKKLSGPLGGEGTYDFTGTATKQSGRMPILG